jgi:hypothetical protein
MKRQPFALPYAGIHKEADLSGNYASAAPVEPAVGDYIADALGGLGIPREQALKLGSAFGLFPEGFRESGRALAAPFVEPTAGNIAGAGVEAALTAVPGAKGAKVAADVAEGAAKKAIKAYHGSPHDFDRFSLDKIGTGEGAQAYGHGLYFADNEAVAKEYREKLKWKNEGTDWNNPQHVARYWFEHFQGDTDAATAYLEKSLKHQTPESKVSVQAAIDALRRGETGAEAHPGRMYEVNINADPEHFLDWDKPLSQQSEAVRRALDATGVPTGFDTSKVTKETVTNAAGKPLDKFMDARGNPIGYLAGDGPFTATRFGGDFDTFPTRSEAEAWLMANQGRALEAKFAHDELEKKLGPAGVSQALREAGIPGIRYLDQGSRGAGEGSSNYVVFDDALVEILRKYGIALPFGLGAAGAGALGQNEPEVY